MADRYELEMNLRPDPKIKGKRSLRVHVMLDEEFARRVISQIISQGGIQSIAYEPEPEKGTPS